MRAWLWAWAAASSATLLLGCTSPSGGGTANVLVRTSGETHAGGRESLGHTPLPCNVQHVLATSCQGCHAADPGAQAPMALVSFEDLTAPAISDPSLKVYELIERRIHADQNVMP